MDIDTELLTLFEQENYASLHEKNFFCDIQVNNKWKVGRIVNLLKDYAHVEYYESSTLPDEKISLSSNRIAYYRKCTKPESSSYRHHKDSNLLLERIKAKIQTIIKNKFDYANTQPYNIIQFFRGDVYYTLDRIFSPCLDSKDIAVSLQIIELYLELLSNYFQFFNENKEYIVVYNNNRSFALINWKCALVSFQEEAIQLLKRIFMNDLCYTDFYCQADSPLTKLVINRYSISKDKKPNGASEGMLELAKASPDKWYDPAITLDIKGASRTIHSIIFAYISDYFYYHKGHKALYDLLNTKDFLIPFPVLKLHLEGIKCTTIGIDSSKNLFLDEKRFLKENIYSRINSMSNVEIKNTPREVILQVIQVLINLLKLEPDIGDYLTLDMILSYLFRCLLSKALDMQISAINLINLMIDHVKIKEIENNPTAPFTDADIYIKNVKNTSLVSFFKEKKMIEIILEEGERDEIIKRCHQIVILMYKYHWGLKEKIHEYSQNIFNTLWRSINEKHSGVSTIVEELISDMAEYADKEDKEFLYEKIKTLLSLSAMVTKEDLTFLKSFTEKCLAPNQSLKKEIENALMKNKGCDDFNKDNKLDENSLFGLARIWMYMQDSYYDAAFSNKEIKDSEKASSLINQCIDYIIFLLHNKLLLISESTKQQFLYLSLLNITQGVSCVQSLIFIKRLLSSEDFLPCYIKLLKNPNTIQSLGISSIINSIILDLKRYNEKVSSYSEPPSENRNDFIFEGYYPHSLNVQIRLENIMLLCSKEKGLPFSFNDLLDLWQTCHKTQSLPLLYQIIHSNISNIDYLLLNEFFTRILLSNDSFVIDSIDSFKLFERTFNEVNVRSKKFFPLYDTFRVNVTMKTDITGLSKLWCLLKEVKDEFIQNQIASMLCDICLKTKTYDDVTLTFWSHFISQLILEMENANNSKDENAIKGLLKLIKLIFENIDDPGKISPNKDDSYIKSSFSAYSFYYKEKPMNLTLTVGENEPFYSVRYRLSYYFQLPVNNIMLMRDGKGFDLNKDFDFFRNIFNSNAVITVVNQKHPILSQKQNPKALILNQQALLSAMIAMLYDQRKSYILNVWKLLKDWPENYELKNIIKTLATVSFEAEKKEIEDNNQNDSIKQSLIKFERENIYYTSFVLCYIKLIIKDESREWLKSFAEGSLAKKIKDIFLGITLKDMNMIEEYEGLIDIITVLTQIYEYEFNEGTKGLITRKILVLISEVFNVDIDKKQQAKMFYHKIIAKLGEMMGLLIALISKYSLVSQFFDVIIEEQKELFCSILTHGLIVSKNKKAKELLLQLILTLIENKQLPEEKKKKILQFIIEIMLEKANIETAIQHTQSKESPNKPTEENYYFTFINSILSNCYEMVSLDFKDLAKTLIDSIATQREVSGYLSILYTIVVHSKEITQELLKSHNMYDLIYNSCLFSKSSIDPLIKQPPKCQSESSREIAYKLLGVLLLNEDNSESFKKQIFANLNKFHSLSKWRTSQIFNWKMSLSENEKNCFVGLKNLGCTCYMNSIFQLFFMLPDLRESILTSKCRKEAQNSLYELKKIMASLKLYESQYCDAVDFCQNADERVLDVREQMDIDEFFVFLIEKIENRLKNTSNADLIKHFFHGKNCDELLFKDGCTHHRENDLSFYSIQLQVKGKKSLYESLEAIIEGELMEGDNSIFCQDCNKKISAMKRQSFKALPRVLSFVLKRFEFDYTNMKKIKVNDFYEFPLELDMAKYTLDHLRNGNYTGSAVYRLKDIVIHAGHSEGGHYYSFIKDYKSANWYEFNDLNVRPFNIDELAQEAFGGKEMSFNQDTNQPEEIEKKRNAYVLFYEKVDTSDCEKYLNVKIVSETAEDNHVPNEIIDKINQEMALYWIQKMLFEKSYHRFVLELVANIVNSSFNPKEFLIFCNFLSRNTNNHISKELLLFRDNYKPMSSNLESVILKGDIRIYPIEESKKIDFEGIFSFFCNFFFNVMMRSKNTTYIAPSVDLIKLCLNHNASCAMWLLDEFCNYDTISEYLIDNPFYEIKKLIVGIIYCALLKLSNEQLPTVTDYLQNFANHFIEFISANIEKENNFLFFVLFRFAQLNPAALNYISMTVPFLEFLLQFRKYKRMRLDEAYDYANRSRGKLRCRLESPSHSILSTTKSLFSSNGQMEDDDTYAQSYKQKEKNKTAAMYRTENYLLLLVCLLMTNERITLNNINKLFNDTEFIMSFLEDVKNKQSAYAVSNLFIHICTNHKALTETIQYLLLKIINSLEIDSAEFIMLIFKRFLVKMNDDLNETRIKSTVEQYLKMILKRSLNFSFMEFHIGFVVKLFSNERVRRYADYFKDSLNKLMDWTKEALKGLSQREQKNSTHAAYESKLMDMKSQLANILKANMLQGDKYDSDVDLTDFKFCIGDYVTYEGKRAIVVTQLDEMIEIEYIKDQKELARSSQASAKKNDKDQKVWVECDSSKLLLKEKFDEDY